MPKLSSESQSASFHVNSNRKPGFSAEELLEKMTEKEKKFYLPYLPTNQKRVSKSPPSVTFQKQSSRESMLLKTTEMELETPIKSYNGKL